MPLSDSISNIIGTKIPYWLWKQFNTRSQKTASEYRDAEVIKFMTNKTAWIRMVSSINIKDGDLEYFSKMNPDITKGDDLAKQYVLFGGTSKYLGNNSYGLRSGFSGLGSNANYGGAYGIIGQTKTELGNEIANYGYRPMPGITNVSIETQGRLGSVRAATVNFKCWDKMQLDVMDALYFKLGFSMFLEWGHTYYFPSPDNPQKLDPSKAVSTELASIDPFDNRYVNNKELMYRQIVKNNRETEGNYDAMLGIVTNFNFSMNQEGGYDCMVKIVSLGVLGDSIKVNNSNKLITILDEQIKEYSNTLEKLRALAPVTGEKLDPIKEDQKNNLIRKILETGKDIKGNPVNFVNSFGSSNEVNPENKTFNTETFGEVLYIKKQGRILRTNATPEITVNLNSAKILEILKKNNVVLNVAGKVEVKNTTTNQGGTTNIRYGLNLNQVPESQRKYAWDLLGENVVISLTGVNDSRTRKLSIKYQPSVNQFIANGIKYESGYEMSFFSNYRMNKNIAEDDNAKKEIDKVLRNAGLITFLESEGGLAREESFFGFIEGNKSEYSIIKGYELDSQEAFDQIKKSIESGAFFLNKSQPIKLEEITSVSIGDSNPAKKIYTFQVSVEVDVVLKSEITVTKVKPAGQAALNVVNNVVYNEALETATIKNIDVTYKPKIIFTFQETDFISSFVVDQALEAQQPQSVPTQQPQTEAFAEQDATRNPFSYLSNIELMLRSIQVHSLVYALKSDAVYGKGQAEDSKIYLKSVVKVPLYEKSATSKPFSEQLFSNGVFQDEVIRELTNGNIPDSLLTANPENANTKDLFKVYAKYGFATKLMANLAPVDKFKAVNYKELLTTYVFPYNVTQQLESGTPMNHPVYIQFGLFLMMLNHSCTLYNAESQFPTPIVYVDYNPNHSLCLTTPIQLSTDPFTAMIPFEGSVEQYKKLFDKEVLQGELQIKAVSGSLPTTLFQPRSSAENPDRDRVSGAMPAFIDNDSINNSLNRGRIMNILLNMDYLSDVIKQFAKKDGENKVFLKPLIEQILTDVNKSIGNFNIFRLAYNDAGNAFQIIDDQVVPVGDQNEQQPYAVTQQGDDPTEIPVFGKGSVAKSLEIKTEVTTRLSNMLAISANSKGKQGSNSTDGSTFGFINYNYTDRYISERGELDTTGSFRINTEGEISSATEFNSAIKYFYCTDALDAQRVSTATNYYIAKLSNFKADDGPTRSSAMIPVSLNFTTDGISGLYMGQAFTVSRDHLPYTYSIKKMFNDQPADNKVGFVITGLNHTIEGNVWNTAVKTNMIFLKRKSDYPTGSLALRTTDTVQSSIEDPNIPSDEYAVYNTSTGIIENYQKGDTVGNVYNGQQIPDKIALEKVQKVFGTMLEAAKKDGVNFTINSGYRNFNEQYALRKQNVKEKSRQNDDQFLRTADASNFNPKTAKPGFSQHQNGIAFDIDTLIDGGKSFEWLSNNAEKYGFVRTVDTERWHWEYRPGRKKYDFIPASNYSWTFGAEPPNKQNA